MEKWAFQTGGPVCHLGVDRGHDGLLSGRGDGFEYAIDTATGAQIWKSPNSVSRPTLGATLQHRITSSADVLNGVSTWAEAASYWSPSMPPPGAILWDV